MAIKRARIYRVGPEFEAVESYGFNHWRIVCQSQNCGYVKHRVLPLPECFEYEAQDVAHQRIGASTDFHHAAVICLRHAGIRGPLDIEPVKSPRKKRISKPNQENNP